MPVYVFADGKYNILAGNKIVKDGELLEMKPSDTMIVNGTAYKLGFDNSCTVLPDDAAIMHINGEEPSGTKWYISPTGSGTKDGTSWENAASYTDTRNIINNGSDGDNVFFAEGTYELTAPMLLPGNVKIYGGFKFDNCSWETRNGFEHKTFFSGYNFTNGAALTDGISFTGTSISGCPECITNGVVHDFFVSNLENPVTFSNAILEGINLESSGKVLTFENVIGSNCSLGGTAAVLNNCTVSQLKSFSLRGASNTIFIDCNCILFFENLSDCRFVQCSFTPYNISVPPGVVLGFGWGISCCTFENCEGQVNCKINEKLLLVNSNVNMSCNNGCTDAIIVNSKITSNYLSFKDSKIINSQLFPGDGESVHLGITANCAIINSCVQKHGFSCGKFSTVVNCDFIGSYYAHCSVLFNNSKGINTDLTHDCAVSEYYKDQIYLGNDNSLSKFTNTGFYPAIGVQNAGNCPSPIDDPEGFDAYIRMFGDWHPAADSILVGKGEYASDYPVDLDGATRPDPPTIGAYEPKIME